MRKNSANNSSNKETAKKEFRVGTKIYESAFAGVNTYGLYIGLKAGEDIDFISGYEALGFLNTILNEFDSIECCYEKKVSTNNKEYEACNVTNYHIAEE